MNHPSISVILLNYYSQDDTTAFGELQGGQEYGSSVWHSEILSAEQCGESPQGLVNTLTIWYIKRDLWGDLISLT